ncbi:protein kinase domain-containing protein [Embleya scabrispora]|uniref:protein kinase domain-containing protein n=1 Tax=Embleya scabrispora TaxID=159449 RepID=UPI00036FD4F8|nr:protein kinase [Embleya scabrispora]MYS85929.1 protein kinase [Streptomyces sp. SID5474]
MASEQRGHSDMRVLAGRYELVQLVGRGGMGEVWKGVDRELGRTVAVKVLPAELTRHEEFRRRFRREARTSAALSHHGVATLHDVGEDVDGADVVPFLVMEYIDGRTLTDALRTGPLPIARAVAMARDVADALVHSHGLGVIHRDIKPSNVMVTESGSVKVLDFGIAKALAETTTRLTATGLMVGTPAYLSPEQIDGDAVDARTDIYSLGCLLYELLTGQPPFTGDSPFAVMNQHLTKQPPPPSALRTDVPAHVDVLTLSALAKSPEQRYADAATFRSALESAQRALSADPTAVAPHSRPTATGTPRSPEADGRFTPGGPAAAVTLLPPGPMPGWPAGSPPGVGGGAGAGNGGGPGVGFGAEVGFGGGFGAGPGVGPYAGAGTTAPLPGNPGEVDPRGGSVRPRSPWTIRYRPTETGAIAVVGWVFLLISTMSLIRFERPVPPILIPAAEVALVLSLLALLWSARLSVTISWAYVVSLNYAALGAPAWIHALPFLGLVPFALAGFVRRRHNPSVLTGLLWIAFAAAWWAQTEYRAAGPREGGYTLVVLIVVAVTGARGLAERGSRSAGDTAPDRRYP